MKEDQGREKDIEDKVKDPQFQEQRWIHGARRRRYSNRGGYIQKWTQRDKPKNQKLKIGNKFDALDIQEDTPEKGKIREGNKDKAGEVNQQKEYVSTEVKENGNMNRQKNNIKEDKGELNKVNQDEADKEGVVSIMKEREVEQNDSSSKDITRINEQKKHKTKEKTSIVDKQKVLNYKRRREVNHQILPNY